MSDLQRRGEGTSEHEDASAKAMPFWDHLDELARRLKVVLYVLFASTILFMVLPTDLSFKWFSSNPYDFYDPLVALVLRAIRAQVLPPDVMLIGIELTAPMELYLIASFVFGFAVTIPVIAYEIYKFIDPALYPHERGAVYPFVTSFTLLFVVGTAFGFFVLLPLTLWALFRFFTVVGAQQVIAIMDFYNMVLVTTVFTGLMFTWPVFFVLLVKFGIAKTSMISKNRKYVYGVMFIAILFITTDGGPFVDGILLLPMVALTEIAVFFGRRQEKSRASIEMQTETVNRCKFCNAEIEPRKGFCDKCGRSQF